MPDKLEIIFVPKILVKKRKEKRNEEIVSNNLRTASGDMAICRVLCYVNTGNKRNGSIEVSLEIVRSFEADDVADDRLKNGLRLLLECPCSDIKLQNNSKIRVKLSGIFTLKKGIDKNYLVMHYNSASKVNIRMFPLIKVQKIDGNPDGIIEIFHHVKNQLFHIITLDPWGRKMLLLQKQESTIYKRLHERNEDKESPTKENSAQVGKSQQDEYFDRINIAAIADVLDEDQIYSISTQIGLPHDQYENMTKEIGYLTPLFKKAKYLSTALQMHDESKVQLTKLREALFAIDRENLALKIEALYWRSEKLSKKVLKGHIY
ncbi:uncharacterized protein LOC134716710 [Mytilus trossulus]|uniref:uncharacterized protein LOC134716710 n=1 Tax=Mytilus trossulus TaxID=6551 RepID=UPI0030055572